MHVLVTNDDGIRAPGLRALREAMLPLGRVSVVAPQSEQSAVGHAISLTTPLTVCKVRRRGELFGWAVKGSPADCVKLAILELLDEPPDLVVSGINLGCNTGINVLYSGTVAAAIEAAFYGITALAFSVERCPRCDFAAAARLCRQIVEEVLRRRPPKGSLFNVNLPRTDRRPPRGVRIVPQGLVGYGEHFKRRVDPRGRSYYWIAGGAGPDPHDGLSDIRALAQGYITITPMKFNLTDTRALKRVARWKWRLEGLS